MGRRGWCNCIPEYHAVGSTRATTVDISDTCQPTDSTSYVLDFECVVDCIFLLQLQTKVVFTMG